MRLRRLIEGLLRRRRAVLAGVAAVTLVLGYFATRLEFESSLEIWFLENDPALVTYHEFLDRFHADEVVVVGVFGDDVFAPEALRAIDALSRELESRPEIHRVLSLTTARIIDAPDEFTVETRDLVPALPTTRAEAEAIRRRALERRAIAGVLVAEDARAAVIVGELSGLGTSLEGKVALTDHLLRLAADPPAGLTLRVSGTPPLDTAIYRYSEQDFAVLAPASVVLVVLATFFLFRRLSAALIPLATVGIACLWTFGLMGLLGLRLNLISTGLVAIIIAVGVADSIHVLSDYYQQLMSGRSPDEAVVESVSELLAPCFFTSATTAAGFLSLMTSDLRPTREFGVLAAVAVGFAFLLSVTFVPCVLRAARPPDPRFIERQREGPITRLLGWLGAPTPRRVRRVAAASAVLVAASVWGVTRIDTGANPMNYFKADDPNRVATEAIDRAIGGTTSLEFLVTARDGALKEPAVLRQLDALQRRLEDLPAVHRVLSVLDGLREAHRYLTDGRPESAVLPDTRPLAAQLYLTLEGDEDFGSLVQGNYSVARMTARANLSEAEALSARAEELEAELRRRFPGDGPYGLRVESTGFVKLMGDMERYYFTSQVRSLLVAFAVIIAMMALLLRSWRLGLFSMIPNVLPILVGLAFMAAAGIHLDPGTVMIGSIALGLVVDDSVHYLVRLRRALRTGRPLAGAIEAAMRATGRPIILTSVILASGFAILGLASFTPTTYFGLVSAVVILLALVADLVVLPAALLLIRPRLPARDA